MGDNIYIASLCSRFMKRAKAIPEQIDIQVTGRCNARCGMCIQEITYKAQDQGERIFSEGVQRNLQSFYELRGKKIIITGGEPTLVPGRVELVLEIAHSLGNWDLIAMYTNGSGLTREHLRDPSRSIAQRLKDLSLQCIDLSVHHYDSEKNRSIFGSRQIDPVQVSTHLQKIGLPFRYCATLQRGGLESGKEVLEYLKFAQQNGAKDVYFRELFRVDRTQVTHPERVNYLDEHLVSLNTILGDLSMRGYSPIDSRNDFQGRKKTQLEYRTSGGFPFYFSQLEIGREVKEELPYLVIMPNGQLHSTWHGKGDYIDDLKEYLRPE